MGTMNKYDQHKSSQQQPGTVTTPTDCQRPHTSTTNWNILPHTKQPATTPTNPSTLTPLKDILHGWGNPIKPIDPHDTLQVITHNTNGLNSKNNDMLQKVSDLGTGILMVLQTNVNFHNAATKARYYKMGRKVWKRHSLITATQTCGRDKIRHPNEYLPGGVAIWIAP